MLLNPRTLFIKDGKVSIHSLSERIGCHSHELKAKLMVNRKFYDDYNFILITDAIELCRQYPVQISSSIIAELEKLS